MELRYNSPVAELMPAPPLTLNEPFGAAGGITEGTGLLAEGQVEEG